MVGVERGTVDVERGDVGEEVRYTHGHAMLRRSGGYRHQDPR